MIVSNYKKIGYYKYTGSFWGDRRSKGIQIRIEHLSMFWQQLDSNVLFTSFKLIFEESEYSLIDDAGQQVMFSQIAAWLLTYEHSCRNVDVISLITNFTFHIHLEYYLQEFIMKLFTGWQWDKTVENLASPILDVKSGLSSWR